MRRAAEDFSGRLCTFGTSLSQFERPNAQRLLSLYVQLLLDDLGWREPCAVRFALLDLPRFHTFPLRRHQHTCQLQRCGRNIILYLNESALDIPNYLELISRLPLVLWTFGRVTATNPDLEGSYMIVVGDGSVWDTIAFSSSNPSACLLPDPTYFLALGFTDFDTAVSAQAPAWRDRTAKVFWRGSTTGIKRYWPPKDGRDFGWLPRLELCYRAKNSPLHNHLDIALSNLVQIDDEELGVKTSIVDANMVSPRVPRLRFADFKAVIDIDGNSDSWARGLYCSLLTRSCVLKVASEHHFRSWYYHQLKPWQHYVPISADLSDFEDAVRWMLNNDDRAQEIGRAGSRLARSLNFTSEMEASVGRLEKWMLARTKS